ncbi:MAG: glycosyltransferase family 1 protein [Acidimicrobiales bacterium]
MRSRIALNALALRPGGGGVQTYIRELLAVLPAVSGAEITAAVQADAAGLLPHGVRPLVRPVCAGARRAACGLRALGPAELVHGLDVDLPLRPGAPTVTTVHDMSVFDVPWAHSRWRGVGERFLIRKALARADAIVAVSSFTAERIRHHLRRDATVAPLAPSPDLRPPSPEVVASVRQAYDLPERFVLQVGTVEPRKDVAGLAAACRTADVPLVLAGAAPMGVPSGVRWLGYVDRSNLAGLYGAATVVAYWSRYEGFGLPPLEAMACGATVVASRVGALADVLGDGGVLLRPGDIGALAATLSRLLVDRQERCALATEARRQAGRYSWAATAMTTVEVYRSLGVAVAGVPVRPLTGLDPP